MERFCYSIVDQKINNEFSNLIKGSGVFRRFKDAIYCYGIENDRYKFRDQALEEIAKEWIDNNEIAFSKAD